MANVKNKKTAQMYQDELDQMLDGLYLEDETDNHTPSETQSQTKSGALSPSTLKKHDIDQLLDGAAQSTTAKNPYPAYNQPLGDEPGYFSSDILSIAANKMTEPTKPDLVAQRDDFELFDEFGELGSLEKVPQSDNVAKPLVVGVTPPSGLQVSAARIDDFEDFEPLAEELLADVTYQSSEPSKTASLSVDAADNHTTTSQSTPTATALPASSAQALATFDDELFAALSEEDVAPEIIIPPSNKQQTPRENETPQVAPKSQHKVTESPSALEIIYPEVLTEKPTDIASLKAPLAVTQPSLTELDIETSFAPPAPLVDKTVTMDDNFPPLQRLTEAVTPAFTEPQRAAAPTVHSKPTQGSTNMADNNIPKDPGAKELLPEGLQFLEDDADDLLVPSALKPRATQESKERFDIPNNVENLQDKTPKSGVLKGPKFTANRSNEARVEPALVAQIRELWAAHNAVKQQVSSALQYKNEAEEFSRAEQLNRQAKERKERKELLELVENNRKQVPKLVYVATGLSALALLLGAGVLFFGWDSITDLKILKEHTAILEEDVAILKLGNAPPIPGLQEDTPKESHRSSGLAALNEFKQQFTNTDENAGGDKAKKTVKVITDSSKNNAKPLGVTAGQWVANLVSYKQDWYAERKVAEFAKRGIMVSVVPVDVKGEIWYLLRSQGFATQEQALQFAEQAKKVLELNSVLVTQDE